MNKKLPRVFANPITNKINNNEKIYCSSNKDIREDVKDNPIKENIETKINRLFKSSKYVYKVNVEITTSSGTQEYKIIGKNKNNLITLENDLIPISTIINIKEI